MSFLEIATKPAQKLCDESLSARRMPENFDEQDRLLFEHEFTKLIPATQLLELNHVNVNSDGIVFSAGRILAESFGYRIQFEAWSEPKNVVKFFVNNYVLRNKERLDEKAVWIVDNWSDAYFHWLMDALPRLYVIRDRLAECTLLLPESYKIAGHILPSLAPFAVTEVKFIGNNQVLRCRKLLVPTHTAPSGNYNENVIRGLRQLYRNHYSGMQLDDASDRIYISRAKARARKLINENEVVGVLKGRGFRLVLLEDYPFDQQVKILMNARYVVSNHGAGLTNMLFMAAGSSVFELRNSADRHSNCYFALASALNLKYYYQLCQPENPDEDAGTANICVDLGRLGENLDLMMAGGSVKQSPPVK